MANNSSYIKSVEEYFLSHAGKGIMLSSVDYELINSWKKRQIPLQLVLSAIRDAFITDQKNNFNSIRNLNSISDIIEESINRNTLNNDNFEQSNNNINYKLKSLFNKINHDIEKNDDKTVIDCLITFKNKILSNTDIINNSILNNINILEQEFMDYLFEMLSTKEKDIVISETEILLEQYRKKITEKAYKQSLQSHRNNILKKKFHITFMD